MSFPKVVSACLIMVVLTTACSGTATPAYRLTYYAQEGDTLQSIAQQYGVTVDDIMEVNDIAAPDKLVAGQPLWVPYTPTPDASAPPTSTPTSTPTPPRSRPTATPAPTRTKRPATPPRSRLSDLILTFRDIDTVFPNEYAPDYMSLSGMFAKHGAIDDLMHSYASKSGFSTLAITLQRYKSRSVSESAVDATVGAFKANGSLPIPLESDVQMRFSPSTMSILDRRYLSALTLLFNQGEVLVIVDMLPISPDQMAKRMDGLIQLALVQKYRLEEHGYR